MHTRRFAPAVGFALKASRADSDASCVITAARTHIAVADEIVPQARLVMALLAITAVLSVAGAMVGHPLFHVKLLTAAAAVKLVWPSIVEG